jgi:hypothetical protein
MALENFEKEKCADLFLGKTLLYEVNPAVERGLLWLTAGLIRAFLSGRAPA